MRNLFLIAAFISGCASAPEQKLYEVPIVAATGKIVTFTTTQPLLFCIEGPDLIVCIAEHGGRATKFVFPRPADPVWDA